jgi:hypothetical protein
MGLFSLRKIHRICPRHCGPGPPAPAHGSTDFIKCWPLTTGSTARIKPIESASLLGCFDPIWRWVAIGSSQPMQESPGADPTVEAAGSGRGRCRLTLTAARHGWARWLTGVRVFSSYCGQFSIRFAPTGSQRWGERVYANLNRRRAATKPGNGEVARPVLIDGEGGLRWSFGSKDVRQGFLELPSSFSTDGFLSCGQKFALYAAIYIRVLRYDHSQQGLQHFPSLHRTLSREDSEEIGKGINAVLNDRLNRFDNGFGSGLDLLRDARPWICWATAPAGWAAPNSARSQFPIKKFFFFSNLFCKLQINLNSNQIWISTTFTHTINYKSTSSLQEKYATAWMQ